MPGDTVSAGWGGRVARHARATTPKAGPGLLARVTPAGTVLSIGAQRKRGPVPPPYPFRAVWIDDEYDGKLCFCLPEGALSVDGEAIDPAEGATAIPASTLSPGTWYHFPSLTLASSGTTRIYCEIAQEGTDITADIVTVPSAGALYFFPVCDLSVLDGQGTAQHLVRQLAIGAQHVSLASGGGGGGSCDCPRKWYNRIAINAAGTQATIANVLVLAGDASLTCADTTVALNTGVNTCIYGHVEMTVDSYDGSVSRSVSICAGSERLTTAGPDFYIPLWLVTADTPRKIYDATVPGIAKRT